MATNITIDPVTRLEGHLKVDVVVDYVNGVPQVIDAKSTGTLFRGFETILKNRNPLDAPDITQRICGVCPVSHGMAATNALEAAGTMTVPANARIMRNIVLGSNYVQSHILHFYHLALLDFVDGPAMPPWQVIKEKRATFAASPAEDAKRPQPLTQWRNLYLAGDFTASALPATIECAIRSGFRAAELVGAAKGRSIH